LTFPSPFSTRYRHLISLERPERERAWN